jgi:hypothetical protein
MIGEFASDDNDDDNDDDDDDDDDDVRPLLATETVISLPVLPVSLDLLLPLLHFYQRISHRHTREAISKYGPTP